MLWNKLQILAQDFLHCFHVRENFPDLQKGHSEYSFIKEEKCFGQKGKEEGFMHVTCRLVSSISGCSHWTFVLDLTETKAVSFFIFFLLELQSFPNAKAFWPWRTHRRWDSLLFSEWCKTNPLCSLECFLKNGKVINMGQKLKISIFLYYQTDEGTEPVSRKYSSTLQA